MLDPINVLHAAQAPSASPSAAPCNALVCGAVGKAGEALLNSVLASPRYQRVGVLTRMPLDSTLARLQPLYIAGDDLPHGEVQIPGYFSAADIFCCLSDTRSFYRRDDVYHRVLPQQVLPLARSALAHGARRLVLVKPAEAASQLGGYGRYLSDAEELDLVQLPFRAVVIVRPHQDRAATRETHLGRRLARGVLSILADYMTPASLRPRRMQTIINACHQALDERGDGIHIIALDSLPADDHAPLSRIT